MSSRAVIECLDNEGRGIAHVEGKTIFIDGALIGEEVEYHSFRRKPRYEQASATAIVHAAAARTSPRCPHFGVCGGCSLQHLEPAAQAAAKQRVLEDALWHIGKLQAEMLYPVILGPAWAYRHRARLAVRMVAKKGGVLVGFHEKRSSFVADMDSCAVLPEKVSALLPKLRQFIGGLSVRERLPQIEVAVGETATALVLRLLQPLSADDADALRAFADAQQVLIYLQSGGPATVLPFHPATPPALAYSLPEFGIEMRFSPTDFTQVNHGINRMLVRRALALLQPRPGERIADMFCGLGNFTLPIARCGAKLVGVEGSAALVAAAADNARRNGLADNCEFRVANLFDATTQSIEALGRFDKMLIDPPREGAIALVKAFAEQGPARIVYVSCNPATLARDAAILVHEQGYRLRGAGIANMFPQTSHVESIALFER